VVTLISDISIISIAERAIRAYICCINAANNTHTQRDEEGIVMAHAQRSDDNVIDLSQRLPTREEIINASETLKFLQEVREKDGSIPIGEREGRPVVLATPIGNMLLNLLSFIAKGEMITLVPKGAMLTTQDAADMLNVSRPYLVKLLKRGEIAFERVGSHRRVPFEVLMAYKEKREEQRKHALDELARLGQEFDEL